MGLSGCTTLLLLVSIMGNYEVFGVLTDILSIIGKLSSISCNPHKMTKLFLVQHL